MISMSCGKYQGLPIQFVPLWGIRQVCVHHAREISEDERQALHQEIRRRESMAERRRRDSALARRRTGR